MRAYGLLLALGLCAATAGGVAASHDPNPPTNAKSTPIARIGKTISGQPLKLPQGPAEAVAAIVDIPAGGATTIHQHPWSRFVYVERGPVRIINHDNGQVTDLESGEFFPEVIAQWHEGRATGSETARLLVIDLVPPGVNNMVMKDSKPM